MLFLRSMIHCNACSASASITQWAIVPLSAKNWPNSPWHNSGIGSWSSILPGVSLSQINPPFELMMTCSLKPQTQPIHALPRLTLPLKTYWRISRLLCGPHRRWRFRRMPPPLRLTSGTAVPRNVDSSVVWEIRRTDGGRHSPSKNS